MKTFKMTAFALVSLVYAQNAFSGTLLSDHVGERVMTSDEVIERLEPKPMIKTRGIQVHEPEQQAISMEIHFEFDSAQLTQQAIAQLTPLGQALQSEQLQGLAFGLEGHTDARGTEEYNLTLSQQRAISVGQFLYENYGVDPQRLHVNGKGEYELLNQQNPEASENRRVVITTMVQ